MSIPAKRLIGDRESSNQARALRGLQETLNRHPRARIYARLARTQRRGVVDASMPNEPPDGPVAAARPNVRVPGPRPLISDQVIRRRFRLSWLDG